MHTAKEGQGFRPNLEAEWLSQPTLGHVGPPLMWVSVGRLPLFSSLATRCAYLSGPLFVDLLINKSQLLDF